MKLYGEHLAYIHDVGFGGFARGAAPGLLALLRKSGIHDGLVVDLGCGSGIWAAELVRSGYDVLGVDISADMIRIARRRVPEARFVRASLLDFALPACRAVTSIGECLSYACDTKNSRLALRRFFRHVYEALSPGGVFVFDIAAPGIAGPDRHRTWLQELDWAVLVETREDVRRRRLERRITSYRRMKTVFVRSDEVHTLRLYEGVDLCSDLERVGFEANCLDRYGRMPMLPGRIAVIARKLRRDPPDE
jgi:SAM-dependent methyltransferase